MRLKSLHSQAFELLCDLLLLYSPSLATTTPALQTLVYLPSDSLRCDMAGFLVDYIFSDVDSSDLNGQYLFCVKFLNKVWFVFQKLLHVNYSNVLMLYHLVSCLVKGEEEMKIKLLQKKRNHLAGYCKMVIYGVLDLVAATDVFKHYSKVDDQVSQMVAGTFRPASLIFAVQEKYVHEN